MENLTSVEEQTTLSRLDYCRLVHSITFNTNTLTKVSENAPEFRCFINHGGDIFTAYTINNQYYALIVLSDGFVFRNKEHSTLKEALDDVYQQLLIDIEELD